MKKPAPSYETQELREFAEVLRGRRTINLYLQTPVPRDLVEEEMVTAAKGAELAAHKRGAWAEKPGWLVVTCQRSDNALREQEDYAACSAAVQNFMLYLWKAGVGSKWTSGAITRDPRFYDIIATDPEEAFVVGMLW